jgi:hypothetical protein
LIKIKLLRVSGLTANTQRSSKYFNMKKVTSFNTHKLLGKATDSKLNSQAKGAVWIQFLAKALKKLKYLFAFLLLIWGNPFSNFHANFSSKKDSSKIELQIKNDSVFNLDLTRKVGQDTTFFIEFIKPS